MAARKPRLFTALLFYTAFFILIQLSFTVINVYLLNIAQPIMSSPVGMGLMHSVILAPLFMFISIQLLMYLWLVISIWFIATTLSPHSSYRLGLSLWLLAILFILTLNYYYYPASFFAQPFAVFPVPPMMTLILIVLLGSPLILTALLALYRVSFCRRHWPAALIMISPVVISGFIMLYQSHTTPSRIDSRPNIILIGLDSVRPDFINNPNRPLHLPNINHFINTATNFTNAYTPLARTFPSWISILTGQYPKHNHARFNLADPTQIISDDTLAKQLQLAGYYTVYGTDEPRFTDIGHEYGFDLILSPPGGAAEMLLSTISDFPLTNLLVNLPISQYLLPYHFGNRGMDITYEPGSFLKKVKSGLNQRPTTQPIFLSIHLCLPHWPFTSAGDNPNDQVSFVKRYERSIERVDVQLGQLLALLDKESLLNNSMVVLLSDHGVSLGLLGDRLLSREKYHGDAKTYQRVKIYPIGGTTEFSTNFKRDFSVNTSYGQGTDILSNTQYHSVFAIKGYQLPIPTQRISGTSSLMDIAPTILSYLQLPPLKQADGISRAYLFTSHSNTGLSDKPFFMETADKINALETENIHVGAIIKQTIDAFNINPHTGLIYANALGKKGMMLDKQRAVIFQHWLLARYPGEYVNPIRLTNTKSLNIDKRIYLPPYFILMNLNTQEWTIGLNTTFAKTAPVASLQKMFDQFYGDEVTAVQDNS